MGVPSQLVFENNIMETLNTDDINVQVIMPKKSEVQE